MRKNVKPFIVIAVVLLTTACESKISQPSASDVAQIWLGIKTNLNTADKEKAVLYAEIDEFNNTLNRFTDSPIGYLYQTHRRGDMRSIQDITAAIDSLKAAIQSGNIREAYLNCLEIDKAVVILQRVDAELSGKSQLNIHMLFFFFVLMVITITLFLTASQKKVNTEKFQHQQSLSFSRETILAQEHERARIARELHDTVAQDLLRLSLQTELIKKDAASEKQKSLCAEVAEGQIELLNRIRNICDVLIPPVFQPGGVNYIPLPDALRGLCHTFEKRAGIECKITIHDNADYSFLDVDMQLHCFRIVQECLANVEKHAKADEVSVVVRSNAERQLLIFVTDNGKGIEKIDKDFFRMMRAKGHFGLWNMQERAVSMNGDLTINSEGREGATVKLIISPPPSITLYPAGE
jgi:signal transduction histidine kinase